MSNLKEYLEYEWRSNNITKYQHYFEEWYSKLTPNQILYYTANSKELKTPYQI